MLATLLLLASVIHGKQYIAFIREIVNAEAR
jgi:hypothetical protein